MLHSQRLNNSPIHLNLNSYGTIIYPEFHTETFAFINGILYWQASLDLFTDI